MRSFIQISEWHATPPRRLHHRALEKLRTGRTTILIGAAGTNLRRINPFRHHVCLARIRQTLQTVRVIQTIRRRVPARFANQLQAYRRCVGYSRRNSDPSTSMMKPNATSEKANGASSGK